MSSTFYRRPLPEGQIAFASPVGRRLFGEALAEGHLESWFPLAQHFHTQAEPAFCGLGTLVVVLNALEIDPGRRWKGPWRWFDEGLLDCCKSLDAVRDDGIALAELACLARCNGARVRVRHAEEADLDTFRRDLLDAVRAPEGPFLVANYERGVLGQTGSGHFSPIAGWHEGTDRALVMDVARFKYPPHWVPLEVLWEAMRPVDPDTGRSRGWLVAERSTLPVALVYRLATDPDRWCGLGPMLHRELPQALAARAPTTVDEALAALIALLPDRVRELVDRGGPTGQPEHDRVLDEVGGRVRGSRLYRRLADIGGLDPAALERLAVALWIWPTDWAPVPVAAELRAALATDGLDPALRAELDGLAEQVRALDGHCGC